MTSMFFPSRSWFSDIILVKIGKRYYTGHLSIRLIKLKWSETWNHSWDLYFIPKHSTRSPEHKVLYTPNVPVHGGKQKSNAISLRPPRYFRRHSVTNIGANEPSRDSGNRRRKSPSLVQALPLNDRLWGRSSSKRRAFSQGMWPRPKTWFWGARRKRYLRYFSTA